MEKHISPKPEFGERFFKYYQDKGKIVMLNMLKFREKADYSKFPQLKPEGEISGADAYKLYSMHTAPELQKVNGRVIYFGSSKHFLIGPDSEKWDAILIVEYDSITNFMALTQSEDYLKTSGHRYAALEDSRLLPTSPLM